MFPNPCWGKHRRALGLCRALSQQGLAVKCTALDRGPGHRQHLRQAWVQIPTPLLGCDLLSHFIFLSLNHASSRQLRECLLCGRLCVNTGDAISLPHTVCRETWGKVNKWRAQHTAGKQQSSSDKCLLPLSFTFLLWGGLCESHANTKAQTGVSCDKHVPRPPGLPLRSEIWWFCYCVYM